MESYVNHLHRAIAISVYSATKEMIEKWSTLNTQYQKIYDITRTQFKTISPLIAFIEAVKQKDHFQSKNLFEDYGKLAQGAKHV